MNRYIFDAETETPAEVAARRRIAYALGGPYAPRNVGEGLSSLGAAIGYRRAMGRADKAQEAGQASAQEAFAPILNGLFGGGGQAPIGDSGAYSPPAGTEEVASYIRQAAEARGIDPDIALKVAGSEGLAPGVWQSNYSKNGVREPSYGPYQLLVGGEGTGYPAGMGNDFMNATGLDPRDPKNVNATIDFALDQAKTSGWSPWYGAAKVGVNRWDGINASPAGASAPPNQVASSGSLKDEVRRIFDMPTGEVPVPQARPEMPVQMAQAAPQQAPQPQQAQQAPQGPIPLPALLQAAQNPWLAQNPMMSGIVKSLIDIQMAQRMPLTPAQQAELQLNQAKLEKTLLENAQLRDPQMTPAEQARIDLDREKFGFEKDQAGATDDTREYDAYVKWSKDNGQQAVGPLEFWTSMKRAGATNVTTNVGGEPGDAALRKELDKKTGELWSTYQETGANSAALTQDMEVIDELIKMAPQGPVTGRLAETFPGFSAAGDAFQSIVKRVAPTLRAPGSGSTSDIEYDGMLRSLPALRNKPEANAAIAQIMKEKAKINIERSSIVDRYRTGDISAAEAQRQMSDLNKRSIMTPEMKRMLEGLAPKSTGDSDLDSLLDKYAD